MPNAENDAWECDHHPEWADNRNVCHHPAHAAENDADEPCLCGTGFTCLASEHTAENDAPNIVQRIVNAWDCCGTCAGGVLARHVRERMAQAWDEGYRAMETDWHDGTRDNPYRVIPPGKQDT